MLKKFGTGKILEEESKGIEKEASSTWTKEDAEELKDENEK